MGRGVKRTVRKPQEEVALAEAMLSPSNGVYFNGDFFGRSGMDVLVHSDRITAEIIIYRRTEWGKDTRQEAETALATFLEEQEIDHKGEDIDNYVEMLIGACKDSYSATHTITLPITNNSSTTYNSFVLTITAILAYLGFHFGIERVYYHN